MQHKMLAPPVGKQEQLYKAVLTALEKNHDIIIENLLPHIAEELKASPLNNTILNILPEAIKKQHIALLTALLPAHIENIKQDKASCPKHLKNIFLQFLKANSQMAELAMPYILAELKNQLRPENVLHHLFLEASLYHDDHIDKTVKLFDACIAENILHPLFAIDENGNTLLHRAAAVSNLYMVKCFLDVAEKLYITEYVHCVNGEGQIPLSEARLDSHLEASECITLLCKAGSLSDFVTKNGQATPITNSIALNKFKISTLSDEESSEPLFYLLKILQFVNAYFYAKNTLDLLVFNLSMAQQKKTSSTIENNFLKLTAVTAIASNLTGNEYLKYLSTLSALAYIVKKFYRKCSTEKATEPLISNDFRNQLINLKMLYSNLCEMQCYNFNSSILREIKIDTLSLTSFKYADAKRYFEKPYQVAQLETWAKNELYRHLKTNFWQNYQANQEPELAPLANKMPHSI